MANLMGTPSGTGKDFTGEFLPQPDGSTKMVAYVQVIPDSVTTAPQLPANAATESTLEKIKPAIDLGTAASNSIKSAVDACTTAVNTFKTALLAVLPASLGAKSSAQSLSVVLASDQSAGLLTATASAKTAAYTEAQGAQSITVACISGTCTIAGGEVLQAGDVRTFSAPYPYKLAAFAVTAGTNYTVSVLR